MYWLVFFRDQVIGPVFITVNLNGETQMVLVPGAMHPAIKNAIENNNILTVH